MEAPAKRNRVEAWRIARQRQKYKSKGAMGCLCEDRTCLWQRWREKDTEDQTTVENKKRKRKQTAVRGQRERARLDDCAE